jgi:hypothetical protein
MEELLFLNLNFSTSRFLVMVPRRILFFGFGLSPYVTHHPVCASSVTSATPTLSSVSHMYVFVTEANVKDEKQDVNKLQGRF